MKKSLISIVVTIFILVLSRTTLQGQRFYHSLNDSNKQYTSIAFENETDNVWLTTSESTVEQWNLKGMFEEEYPLLDGENTFYPFSIFIDENSIKWIGTDKGLIKFDCINKNWEIFSTTNSDIHVDSITHVLADNEGNIWCASDYGVSIFDGQNWESILTEKVIGIQKDDKGIVWLGHTSGINRIENGYWDYHQFGTYTYPGISCYNPIPTTVVVNAFRLAMDNNDNPIISSDAQPGRYNEDGNYFYFDYEDLGSYVITDKNDDYWWVSNQKLNHKLDEYNVNRIEYSNLEMDPKILIFDKNENLWISHYKGLSIYGDMHHVVIDMNDPCTIPEPEQTPQIASVIFPNPSNGIFSLNLPNQNIVKPQIKVINSIGEIFFEKILYDSNNLDLSFLKNGIYFIKIKQGEWEYVEKIIIL